MIQPRFLSHSLILWSQGKNLCTESTLFETHTHPGGCSSWGHGTGQCGVVCNAGSGDTSPACHNWCGVGMERSGGVPTPPALLRAASQGVSSWCHASLRWRSSQDSCKAFLWPFPLQGHRLCCLVAILLCSFPANCYSPLFSSSWVVSVATPSDFVVSWGSLVLWKPDRHISGCSVGTRALFHLNWGQLDDKLKGLQSRGKNEPELRCGWRKMKGMGFAHILAEWYLIGLW